MTEDVVMARLRSLFDRSDLTLHELGVAMGYPEKTARNHVWQFLTKTHDPRLSMLRRFAKALDVPLVELITGP